jgi:hypothetical protein
MINHSSFILSDGVISCRTSALVYEIRAVSHITNLRDTARVSTDFEAKTDPFEHILVLWRKNKILKSFKLQIFSHHIYQITTINRLYH